MFLLQWAKFYVVTFPKNVLKRKIYLVKWLNGAFSGHLGPKKLLIVPKKHACKQGVYTVTILRGLRPRWGDCLE